MEANQNFQEENEHEKPLSSAALWGFIVSFLGIFMVPVLVSIPLSIVGLVKTGSGKMRGFGLAIAGLIISVLIVPFIAIVAAIAIPSLLVNQSAVNENRAQATLKSIVTAQATYTTMYKRYAPNLAALAKTGVLREAEFRSCTEPGYDSIVLNGYLFEMTEGRTWTATSFFVRCKPESATSGRQNFATDTTGKVVTTMSY